MKWLFVTIFSGLIIAFLLGIFLVNKLRQGKEINETRTVFIKKTDRGFQLYRNGQPFYIKGAGGSTLFKELADIGANTVRVYDTINIQNILDEAHKNNLAVVVDIPLPKYTVQYNSYLNVDENLVRKIKIRNLVGKYKNHPALLMWNLGNEVHYPVFLYKDRIKRFFNKSYYAQETNFIKIYNELLDVIQSEDPNHLVCTTVIATDNWREIESIYLNSPKIDLLSYNIFAKIKTFSFRYPRLDFLFGPRPYYISEWGSDGHWETEPSLWKAPYEPTSTKKAEQIRERYEILTHTNDGLCLGNLVFYWGQKQEITHTWFGIIDEFGRKSQSFYELKNCWKNQNNTIDFVPKINYMVVDNKTKRDDLLVFKPNEIKNAQIFLLETQDAKLKYEWEVYEEGWNYYGANARQKKTKLIEGCIENHADSIVSFRTPLIEGPYRIFVHIYDEYGNFATTNTPFYVLNSNE
jgi:hypothetical protein